MPNELSMTRREMLGTASAVGGLALLGSPSPVMAQDALDKAVQAFRKVVGEQWVYTSAVSRDLYRDDYSPFSGTEQEPVPSAAVAPKNTEEVQRIVEICNQLRIPFWVISTGKNLGFGGAAPMRSDMITLDLKRMNRIIEVNEKQAYAVVEPGVSFLDLYRHIQARGLKLWMTVPSPGWGSVIANSLEHGSGYGFQGDHIMSLCGLEVVLPTGELLRTGMGAMANASQAHNIKYSVGAHLDGLFAQSNLGVVTRAGYWLMPEPQAFASATIKVYGLEDLIPLVDLATQLRLKGAIGSSVRIGVGLTDLAHDPEFNRSALDALVDPAEMQKALLAVMQQKNLGAWHARMGFYGSPNLIRAQWEEVRTAYEQIPNVQFDYQQYEVPLANPEQLDVKTKLIAGVPSLADWVTNGRVEGHILNSPVLPADGESALRAHRLATQVHQEFGRAFGGAEMLSRTPREILMTMGAEIFKSDPAANNVTIRLFKQLSIEFAKQGWGEIRAHPALMESVQNTYGWNNHAMRRVNERLKDSLDPLGVMAPGKNGIYPRRMRPS